MAKYLYGANVKAVQSFIFQTSELKEIIGASELVEQICTTLFEDQFTEQLGKDSNQSGKFIVSAAGLVKYIFDTKEDCEKIALIFPMVVFNAAPGIVFNQAVVEIAGVDPTKDELKQLEERLKTQRNKAVPPLETGLRIMERSRRTGLPAIKKVEDNDDLLPNTSGEQPEKKQSEYLDKASALKRKAKDKGITGLSTKLKNAINSAISQEEDGTEKLEFVFPEDLKELADENSFIAIIHADGNNLGKAIRKLNEEDTEKNDIENASERNKIFSNAIEETTLAAAGKAIATAFKASIDKPKLINGKLTVKLPMRPVIIGGDDFTVICDASYALRLTQTYLAAFEEQSATNLEKIGIGKLTACAGIAIIKKNYPFHYGADLAEALCKYAKETAKQGNTENVPGCFAFHRVQSSFVGSYKEIIKRELTAYPSRIQFSAGPYFISHPTLPTVDKLWGQVRCLNDPDTPVSKLREWISTCYSYQSKAAEELAQIITKLKEGDQKSKDVVKNLELHSLLKALKATLVTTTPVSPNGTPLVNNEEDAVLIKTTLYDAITIHSLNSKY